MFVHARANMRHCVHCGLVRGRERLLEVTRKMGEFFEWGSTLRDQKELDILVRVSQVLHRAN